MVKAFIAWLVSRASGLDGEFLRELIQRLPPFIKAVTPLPGPGEVRAYLTRVGIVEPTAPVVELFWERWLARDGQAVVEAIDGDPELHYLMEASPEAATEYLVQMVREELAKPCAGERDPKFDPTIIIMLVQVLGPIVLDLIREWRRRRNQPQPKPAPPPTI